MNNPAFFLLLLANVLVSMLFGDVLKTVSPPFEWQWIMLIGCSGVMMTLCCLIGMVVQQDRTCGGPR